MTHQENNTEVYDFDTIYPRHNQGADKWAIMQRDGKRDFAADVFPFSVADMDFKTAPEIQAALCSAANYGIFGYSTPTAQYYQAVCDWQARRHQFNCRPEWIIQVPNVVYGLIHLVETCTEKGDGVIIQPPVYPPFFSAVENQQRRLVCNPLICRAGHYEMDFDDLARKAADPQTKMMILCNPHNPVGRVWTRAELAETARICLENHVMLISDEIHADLVYAPNRHITLAGLDPELTRQCVICTSPSKTFNLASLATANLIIPDEKKRNVFRQMSDRIGIHGANYLGTVACQAAYEQGEAWYQELIRYLTANRNYFLSFMAEHLPRLPVCQTEGTYLGWIDARATGLDTAGLERFTHQAGLYFMEGVYFGKEGAGFERINFALPRAALAAGLQRLQQAVESLKA